MRTFHQLVANTLVASVTNNFLWFALTFWVYLETAASPVTAFLIGPIAQFLVIPSMTGGDGADAIGGWFGTGPERGMALIFIVAGSIGLAITILAFRSRAYLNLSTRYAAAARSRDDRDPAASVTAT